MVERDFEENRLQEFARRTEGECVKYVVEVFHASDPENDEDCLMETWTNEQGKHHRDFGPAHIAISTQSGKPFRQEWYQNGKLHRDNGPALLFTNPHTDEVIESRYFKNGDEFFPLAKDVNSPAP